MTIHYTFSGEKFMVEMTNDSDVKDVPEYLNRLYLGGLEFEYTKSSGDWGDFEPRAYYHGDGRYLYDGNRYQYFLTDHLGNTAVIFEDKNGDGEITQTDNPLTNEVIDRYIYYSRRDLGDSKEEPLARPNPAKQRDSFGLRWEMPEPYEIDYEDENHYRYNGKEWDRISEWYDYGWRWYDPVIGRWNAVDPLADHPNQVAMSPYAYAWNNPIILIDPDGLCPDCGNNVLKLYAYPYRVIGGKIARGVSKFSDKYLKGGLYITSHYFTVGGEKNVRQGDGDNVSNLIDDSPYAMGYSYLHNNFDNTETVPMDNIPNSGDNMFELVPTPEPGLVNPSDGSYSSQGNRTEVDFGNQDWIGDDPKPGSTDTILNSDGSRTERQRVKTSGSLIKRNID